MNTQEISRRLREIAGFLERPIEKNPSREKELVEELLDTFYHEKKLAQAYLEEVQKKGLSINSIEAEGYLRGITDSLESITVIGADYIEKENL